MQLNIPSSKFEENTHAKHIAREFVSPADFDAEDAVLFQQGYPHVDDFCLSSHPKWFGVFVLI